MEFEDMKRVLVKEKCPKCDDTGIVKDDTGVHVCWDCLEKGKLDPYSKNN